VKTITYNTPKINVSLPFLLKQDFLLTYLKLLGVENGLSIVDNSTINILAIKPNKKTSFLIFKYSEIKQ